MEVNMVFKKNLPLCQCQAGTTVWRSSSYLPTAWQWSVHATRRKGRHTYPQAQHWNPRCCFIRAVGSKSCFLLVRKPMRFIVVGNLTNIVSKAQLFFSVHCLQKLSCFVFVYGCKNQRTTGCPTKQRGPSSLPRRKNHQCRSFILGSLAWV